MPLTLPSAGLHGSRRPLGPSFPACSGVGRRRRRPNRAAPPAALPPLLNLSKLVDTALKRRLPSQVITGIHQTGAAIRWFFHRAGPRRARLRANTIAPHGSHADRTMIPAQEYERVLERLLGAAFTVKLGLVLDLQPADVLLKLLDAKAGPVQRPLRVADPLQRHRWPRVIVKRKLVVQLGETLGHPGPNSLVVVAGFSGDSRLGFVAENHAVGDRPLLVGQRSRIRDRSFSFPPMAGMCAVPTHDGGLPSRENG